MSDNKDDNGIKRGCVVYGQEDKDREVHEEEKYYVEEVEEEKEIEVHEDKKYYAEE